MLLTSYGHCDVAGRILWVQLCFHFEVSFLQSQYCLNDLTSLTSQHSAAASMLWALYNPICLGELPLKY